MLNAWLHNFLLESGFLFLVDWLRCPLLEELDELDVDDFDESELESENMSDEDEVELSDGSVDGESLMGWIIGQLWFDIDNNSSILSVSVVLFCLIGSLLWDISIDESSLRFVSSISVRSETIWLCLVDFV